MSSSVWGKIEKPEVNLEEIMNEQKTALIVAKKESRPVQDSEDTKENKKYQQVSPKSTQTARNNENDQESEAPNFELATHQTKFNQEKEYCYKDFIGFTPYVSIFKEDDYVSDSSRDNWDWSDSENENLALMPSRYVNSLSASSKLPNEGGKENYTFFPSHANKSYRHRKELSIGYKKTIDFDFEKHTVQLLDKMIEDDILGGLYKMLYAGTKTKILLAHVSAYCKQIQGGQDCIIKVFQKTCTEFEEYSLKSRITRRMLHNEAEREMSILRRLKKVGIPCPEVLVLKNNVLVTSFIGLYEWPAHNLSVHVRMNSDSSDNISAYNQVVKMMKKFYQEAKLVHGRLSDEKILWHENKCYFIGWRKAVDVSHKNASHLLYKDCKNIIKFFKDKVGNVTTPDRLYKSIVGTHS